MDADESLSRAVWRKSTFSNGSGGNCVEVASNLPGIVAVRDSKDPHGPVLIVNRDEWATFITQLCRAQPCDVAAASRREA